MSPSEVQWFEQYRLQGLQGQVLYDGRVSIRIFPGSHIPLTIPLHDHVLTEYTISSTRRSLSTAALTRCSFDAQHGVPTHIKASASLGTAHASQKRNMASSPSQYHDSLVQFGKKHVTAGLGRVVDAVLTKGEGSYVTLGDGRRLLDFTCGIGVTNLGECIRRVLSRLRDGRLIIIA